jgi:hypothetical protein
MERIGRTLFAFLQNWQGRSAGWRQSDAGHGATPAPSGRAGVDSRRWAALPHGWRQRVGRGAAPPWRPGGPAPTPRWIPLPPQLYAQVVKSRRGRRAGAGAAPGGMRHARAGQARAGGGGTAGHHAVQGRGRRAAAARFVPDVPQLLLAAWQLPPSRGPACAYQRDRLSRAVAAWHASDGRGPDWSTSGRCARWCAFGCHRGHRPKRCQWGGGMMIG